VGGVSFGIRGSRLDQMPEGGMQNLAGKLKTRIRTVKPLRYRSGVLVVLSTIVLVACGSTPSDAGSTVVEGCPSAEEWTIALAPPSDGPGVMASPSQPAPPLCSRDSERVYQDPGALDLTVSETTGIQNALDGARDSDPHCRALKAQITAGVDKSDMQCRRAFQRVQEIKRILRDTDLNPQDIKVYYEIGDTTSVNVYFDSDPDG
jgi:hypothetical protein